MLTVEEDEKSITTAFINGADGYILKDISPEELSAVIRNAYNNVSNVQERAFNLARKTAGGGANPDDDYMPVNFTGREKEVLGLVVDGMTNEEISDTLGISVGRARNIVTDLISKCLVRNRTQLAVIAVKMDVVMRS